MQMHPRILRLLLVLPFAACSGGSGGDTAPQTTGSVHVVVETATGSEAFVQYEVGAAAFEYRDGSTTPNVLPAGRTVTFADPTGQVDGLALRNVPSGDFTALHLMLVPNGGAAVQPGGAVLPATSRVDLEIPIAGGLQHNDLADSWLVVGHDAGAPVPGVANWTPRLSARADGSLVEIDSLRAAWVEGDRVAARCGAADDGVLRLEFAAGCAFAREDGAGTRTVRQVEFLADLAGDDLRARIELDRDGRALVHWIRRCGANDGPRLLGRITEIEAATDSFVLEVFAEIQRRGGPRLLRPRTSVRIDAADAELRRPNGDPIAFADLQVGNLAKVAWTERIQTPDELDVFVASEVEVTAFAVPMRPEWQGLVQSVDVAANTIVVVPRNDDPIVIDGVEVAQATLGVGDDTLIVRRARHGPGRTVIGIEDIVAGEDRIWWRGTVTGADTIDASWIRVRQE